MKQKIFEGVINGVTYNDPVEFSKAFAKISTECTNFSAISSWKEIDVPDTQSVTNGTKQEINPNCCGNEIEDEVMRGKTYAELLEEETEFFNNEIKINDATVVECMRFNRGMCQIDEYVRGIKSIMKSVKMTMERDIQTNQYSPTSAKIISDLIEQEYVRLNDEHLKTGYKIGDMLGDMDKLDDEIKSAWDQIQSKYIRACEGNYVEERTKYDLDSLLDEKKRYCKEILGLEGISYAQELLINYYKELKQMLG